MILNLILTTFIVLFAYLLKESTKENKKLAAETASYQAQSKRLLSDFDNSRREQDRLNDRNSYLEGKLNSFTKENEMLVTKNDELTQLYLLAKEDANKLKFKLIQLEESMKSKAQVSKKKRKPTKKK
jgi:hypothetical protein